MNTKKARVKTGLFCYNNYIFLTVLRLLKNIF